MSSLTIYKDNYSDCTAISNLFIDEYMVDANDAQIKVYLYLIRMMSANRETDISDMADKFNHTEKDILRSLKYWEKKQLLSLEYDNAGKLTGIRLTDPAGCARPTVRPTASIVPIKQQQQQSKDDLKTFKESPDAAQILFIAETYLGRQLGMPDIETLCFISSELKFSCELVDFLLQSYIDNCKKSLNYIRKVAIDWAENGVTNVKQAKAYLKSRESSFSAKKPAAKQTKNSFTRIEQNDYDFEALERKLLSN